jgi:hypothetical protein
MLELPACDEKLTNRNGARNCKTIFGYFELKAALNSLSQYVLKGKRHDSVGSNSVRNNHSAVLMLVTGRSRLLLPPRKNACWAHLGRHIDYGHCRDKNIRHDDDINMKWCGQSCRIVGTISKDTFSYFSQHCFALFRSADRRTMHLYCAAPLRYTMLVDVTYVIPYPGILCRAFLQTMARGWPRWCLTPRRTDGMVHTGLVRNSRWILTPSTGWRTGRQEVPG